MDLNKFQENWITTSIIGRSGFTERNFNYNFNPKPLHPHFFHNDRNTSLLKPKTFAKKIWILILHDTKNFKNVCSRPVPTPPEVCVKLTNYAPGMEVKRSTRYRRCTTAFTARSTNPDYFRPRTSLIFQRLEPRH